MYNTSSYKEQLKNPLTKEEIFELLDQFREFFIECHCGGLIAITGGDLLLSPCFWIPGVCTKLSQRRIKECSPFINHGWFYNPFI
jgi:hypothetical protein